MFGNLSAVALEGASGKERSLGLVARLGKDILNFNNY